MRLAHDIEAAVLRQTRRGLRALHIQRERSQGDLQRIEDFKIPGPDGDIPARLYQPNDSSVLPLIVFFHGGGFVCCDMDTHHSVCVALTESSGARVISVDYRLAPETRFPGQVSDARTACSWALENAALLHAQPGVIAVAGDSAGAYLAARMAAEFNEKTPGSVALQLLLYPLVHVDDSLWAEEELRNFRFLGRVASLYIARALGEPMPSLLQGSLKAAPVSIVAGGTSLDPVRRDVKAYNSALRDAGVRVIDREYAFLMHGGFNFNLYLSAADKALRELGALAREELAVLRVSV